MNIIESNLNFKGLIWCNKPNKIILHHAEAKSCTIEQIHQWHLENGWSGCGYHFLVRKDGTIYRGRPETALGSHCKGSNNGSIGICAEGNYMHETMPEAQRKAIIELCVYLKGKYNIHLIYKHKDLFETNCPGTNFPFESIKQCFAANIYIPIQTDFLKLDGGGTILNNTAAINLIIKDFSKDVNRIFAWVDNDKNASWAFDLTPFNSNYTKLIKNANKVITTRNGGYSFSNGSVYKITAKGYNSFGKVITENKITIKTPCN